MKEIKIKEELPEEVITAIQNHIKEKASPMRQKATWMRAQTNEDTLVGDFFGGMSSEFSNPVQGYKWKLDYSKFSSAKSGLEKLTGADGIIRFVINDGIKENVKTILFQAKKGNSYTGLREQCECMSSILPQGSTIIRFTERGVSVQNWNKNKSKYETKKKFEKYIIDDFIECLWGEWDVDYDQVNKTIRVRKSMLKDIPKHLLSIVVEKKCSDK